MQNRETFAIAVHKERCVELVPHSLLRSLFQKDRTPTGRCSVFSPHVRAVHLRERPVLRQFFGLRAQRSVQVYWANLAQVHTVSILGSFQL